MRQLLVELGAQAGQFLGLGQGVGIDDFVEPGDEGMIAVQMIGIVQPVGIAPARRARRAVLVHAGFAGVFLGQREAVRVLGLAAAVLAGRGHGLALGAGLLVARVLAVLLVLGIFFRVGRQVLQFGDFQRLHQLAGGQRIGLLVVHPLGQLAEQRADAAVEPGAPLIGEAFGRTRHRNTAEPFAHHQAERIEQVAFLADQDLGIAFGATDFVLAQGQIAGDAGHPAAAERLDPCLFQGVVQPSGQGAGRHPLHVQLFIMETIAQRQRVGCGAQARQILARHAASRGRQTGRAARAASRAVHVFDRDLVLIGNGLEYRRRGALDHVSRGSSPWLTVTAPGAR